MAPGSTASMAARSGSSLFARRRRSRAGSAAHLQSGRRTRADSVRGGGARLDRDRRRRAPLGRYSAAGGATAPSRSGNAAISLDHLARQSPRGGLARVLLHQRHRHASLLEPGCGVQAANARANHHRGRLRRADGCKQRGTADGEAHDELKCLLTDRYISCCPDGGGDTLIAVDSSGLALRLLGADGTEAWSFTGSGCAACGIPAAGAELLADIKHRAEDAEAEVRSYQQRGWLGKSAEFSKVAETLWEHHEALLAQLAPTRLQRLRSGRRAGGLRAARGGKTEHGRLAAEGLLASQHAILDGFLTDTSELRAWVRTLRGRGELHPGEGVSRGAQPASRGDLMRWCHFRLGTGRVPARLPEQAGYAGARDPGLARG